MTNIIGLAVTAAIASVVAPAAASAQDGGERPEVLTRLIDCRSVADPAARLACYDTQVAALDEAEKQRRVVVVDREQVREARRGLFGLTLPRIALFDSGDDDEDAEAFKEIETTIKSASQNGRGRWTIVLADGARWFQTDTRELVIEPRAGQPIRIRQAAMGSYLANVNGQTAIRMRRVN